MVPPTAVISVYTEITEMGEGVWEHGVAPEQAKNKSLRDDKQ
jgi:hypothetical protein